MLPNRGVVIDGDYLDNLQEQYDFEDDEYDPTDEELDEIEQEGDECR